MFFHVNNLLYWNMYLPVINCILNAMCMNHLKFTKDREFEWQIVLNLAVILACFASVFRILANRQSAQRSRVRKLQYISELERSVTTLQVIHQFNSLSKKKQKERERKRLQLSKILSKMHLWSEILNVWLIVTADGGVSTVTSCGLPWSSAVAAHRRQQPSQAKNRRPRTRQDLQRWYQISLSIFCIEFLQLQ